MFHQASGRRGSKADNVRAVNVFDYWEFIFGCILAEMYGMK